MLTVPEQLNKTFETQLSLRNIPVHQRSYFHKWLRYYLDFCAKHRLDDVKGFLSHLAVNKQVAASSQNQAFNAQACLVFLTQKNAL